MTLRIGRATLTTPQEGDVSASNTVDGGGLVTGMPNPIQTAVGAESVSLTGREHGAGAAAAIALMTRERKRLGSKYCSDSSPTPVIPAGYYAVRMFAYRMPRGAPSVRPWKLELVSTPMPWLVRQAQDDNVLGADTADINGDEGYRVTYTPTTGDVAVLKPREVAGAEPLNLPAGFWRVIARVYQNTYTSALFRWQLTDLAGALITTTGQVGLVAPDEWSTIDLGVLEVPPAFAGANWYEVRVQGVAGELEDVWIDHLMFLPR